jgi:hypothetical protein
MPASGAANPPCPWCGSAATRLITVAVNLFVPLYSCLNCDRFWRQPQAAPIDKGLPPNRTARHL